MKRSFRVATVFTGAAALTGAFGGMAAAAHASDFPISGDTHQQNCSLDANYVHLYYPSGHGPVCFGGKGALGFSPRVSLYGICGGNNSGLVAGISTGRADPDGWTIKFGHGTYEAPFHDWGDNGTYIEGNLRVSGLKITDWSGNDKCPS